MSSVPDPSPRTVDFRERLLGSAGFDELFREGMALVEATATYLDGPGRQDCAALPRPAAVAYARESMKHTTRLMQIAAWLLVQRTVREGGMTAETARRERERIDLRDAAPLPEDEAARLPQGLVDLIRASLDLNRRVVRLDASLYGEPAAEQANPVDRQIGRLRAAFERR